MDTVTANSVYRNSNNRLIDVDRVYKENGESMIDFTFGVSCTLPLKEFLKQKLNFVGFRPVIKLCKIRFDVYEVVICDEKENILTSDTLLVRHSKKYRTNLLFRDNSLLLSTRWSKNVIKFLVEEVNNRFNLDLKSSRAKVLVGDLNMARSLTMDKIRAEYRAEDIIRGTHKVKDITYPDMASNPMAIKLLGPNHPVTEDIQLAQARSKHHANDRDFFGQHVMSGNSFGEYNIRGDWTKDWRPQEVEV